MTPSAQTVAFLGTGTMGGPMACNLVRAGFDVVAWNRTPARTSRLAAPGMRAVATPAQAMRAARCAIVMLSTGPVVDEVLFRPDVAGVVPVDALAEDSLLIVMSSIPVDTCRRQAAYLARRRVLYVDAPVSGGERGAQAASLAILAGGTLAAVARAAPIFAALGRVTRIGDVGAGQLAKLANQIIVGITVAAVAEALHFARAGGADPAAVRSAIEGGFADSTVLRQHGVRMVEGDFAPGGTATFQLKDLVTADALAGSLGLQLPLLDAARHLFAAMVQNGDGELDHSAVIREIARRGPSPQVAA